MITRKQAISENEFHYVIGSYHKVWRRNGKTQTWKTRPNDYRTPIKHGLYSCAQLTVGTSEHMYTVNECPVCASSKTT